MSRVLPIGDLPQELTPQQAVAAGYSAELALISEKLQHRLPVLIECEKQLFEYVYALLRERLSPPNGAWNLALVDGRGLPQPTLLGRLTAHLAQAVRAATGERELIVVPHLDLMTTTTESMLTAEAREVICLLYENPEAVFLAFKDPSLSLPAGVRDLFPVRVNLCGIRRERLAQLVLQREARKFHNREFNPFALYKYVSGLNPVRLRQLLGQFADRADWTPEHPETGERLVRDIRTYTAGAQFEMPNIDIERDIGGYTAVKRHLRDELLAVIRRRDALTDERAISAVEQLVPNGIIFWGPPGTGKTMFAKALATALDAVVLVVSGPELKSKWYGETEENIRRLFRQARANAPAVIIFDELDAIAARRGEDAGGRLNNSVVNQLLTELDGFRGEESVLVVGTTNYLEGLDPALLRPGRFEFHIHVPYPDADDRRAIIDVYRRSLHLHCDEAALDHLVRRTAGPVPGAAASRYTGDHLCALMRALKREELRRGEPLTVTPAEIDAALRRQRPAAPAATPQEREVIALHEAGHAVLCVLIPHAPAIDRVVVGEAGEDAVGAVINRARDNQYVLTRAELQAYLAVCLGGLLAEELLGAAIPAGARQDLAAAHRLARLMAGELGMAEGTFPLPNGEQGVRDLGSAAHDAFDAAVHVLVDAQRQRARALLTERRATVQALARELSARGELQADEVTRIVRETESG